MNFLEIKEQFEMKQTNKFDLLELHYTPYSFGSGLIAYNIKGRIVKIIHEGREGQIELLVSEKHAKYPEAKLTTIFTGVPVEFFASGMTKLNNLN